jgi:hypothetical protein
MRQEIVGLTEHTCLDIDQIENYLLQHLNELEIAVVEDKLLVCERCREIYSLVETYVCEIRRVMSIALDQPAPFVCSSQKSGQLEPDTAEPRARDPLERALPATNRA